MEAVRDGASRLLKSVGVITSPCLDRFKILRFVLPHVHSSVYDSIGITGYRTVITVRHAVEVHGWIAGYTDQLINIPRRIEIRSCLTLRRRTQEFIPTPEKLVDDFDVTASSRYAGNSRYSSIYCLVHPVLPYPDPCLCVTVY